MLYLSDTVRSFHSRCGNTAPEEPFPTAVSKSPHVRTDRSNSGWEEFWGLCELVNYSLLVKQSEHLHGCSREIFANWKYLLPGSLRRVALDTGTDITTERPSSRTYLCYS